MLVLIREPRVLQRYTYTLGAVGILLVALPALLPASISEVYGAKIQIRFGSFTTIQPEEFAKLALAVSFAGYLVAKRDVLALAGRRVLGIDLPRARDLGPILLAWAASLLLLVFESDIGTSAVFMGLFVAMLYIATSRTSWLLIGFLMFVAGAFAASKLVPHVQERFDIWLHPFTAANAQGNAYQLVQGLYGMASGGLLGKGLGGGQPYITPLVQSDLVFTAFGEELGLAGLMAILLIYGLIVQRGLRTAILGQGPVLQAAGRRPVLHAGPSGVRHRRRRHPAHPADRHHHPVPVAGRVLAGGQLDPHRPAGPGERHRPAPAAAADPGRRTDPGGDAEMNRALRRISIAVLVMFVLLLVNVNYLQGFDTASLASKPGNSRAFYAAQNQYQRGSIVTADGKVIAASRLSSGNDSIKYQRYYPSGPEYAPVTGYYSIYGETGIEAAENSLLSGNDSSLDVRKFIDLITGKTTKGATVQVTVNSKAQDAAWNALKALGKPGAVVALNPKTGAILAMASLPQLRPQRAGHP